MVERIQHSKILATLQEKLKSRNFESSRAKTIGEIFVQNSLEGVYSHGVNRFPRFIRDVDKGNVIPDANPVIKSKFNGVQQWDGQQGPGITNALLATEATMHLSNHYGIGCVAMGRTNHWMRGGTYGRIAAKKGYTFIGWTNTIANMPAWGARNNKLGNNPLVMAVPGDNPIVIDMAMSQFSYGKMEDLAMKGENLPLAGGYNSKGELTSDPKEILKAGRPVPVGYWKGAGLSLLLDILATILSGGLSTSEVTELESETSLSQVFICIDHSNLSNTNNLVDRIQEIIRDYHDSVPASEYSTIIHPGQRAQEISKENLRDGIPVLTSIWKEINQL